MRDFPAYGRTIAAHIARGQKPIAVGVLLSSRWWYFDHVPKVCIKPEEWKPGRYEFGWLHGMHVVAVPGDDCTDLMLAELLVDLMAAGPRLLWAYDVGGAKLYDEDIPGGVSEWVRELRARAGVDWRPGWKKVKAAEARMRAAVVAAVDLWQRESARIQEKSGLEAWGRWQLAQDAQPARVRELFSMPERHEHAAA